MMIQGVINMGQIFLWVFIIAGVAGAINGVVNAEKIKAKRKAKRRERVKKVRTKFSNFNNDTKPE